MAKIRAYLLLESNGKAEVEWKVVTNEHNPQQNNLDDCGVFMLKVLEYRAFDLLPNFSCLDIPSFREAMILRISTGTLVEEGTDC